MNSRPFTYLEAYVEATWCKFFCFTGRASRGEFWRYVAMQSVFIGITYILIAILFWGSFLQGGGKAIVTLLNLYFLLPGSGIQVRRLHDIGRSGYWIFISIIPIIGVLVLLIFELLSGDRHTNQYGEPQEEQSAGHIEEIHSLGYKPYMPLVIIWVIAIIGASFS